MDITQIEAFLAIARLGSFSKAAAKLHRSQPAISRRIRLLEAEVGAPLFERIHTRVQLTDAGRALCPHAEAVLAAGTSGMEAVREQLGKGAGTVALGIVGTLLDAPLARALARFAGKRRPPRLSITTRTSETVSAMVRAGEATIGLRYFVDRGADLVCTQIGKEPMVVVSAPPSTAARSASRHDDAPHASWIGFSDAPLTRDEFGPLLRKRLNQAGIHEPHIMIVDSLSAQKRLIEVGLGRGLLPLSSVRRELEEGSLTQLDMPEVSTEIAVTLVHRRGGYLSPAAIELMAALRSRWEHTTGRVRRRARAR